MKMLLVLALALGLAAALKAAAAETEKALELRPKAAIAASVATKHAPFMFAPGDEPDVDFITRQDPVEESPSACNAQRALCYDSRSGHIVYRPARNFMPDLPGLQRENISVKRDRIVFRYSF